MKTNRIYGCRYVAAAFLFAFLLFFVPFGSVQAKKGDNAVPVIMQPTAKATAKELKQEEDDLHLYDSNGNRMKNNAWVSYGEQLYFPNAEGKVYRHTILRFGDERAYYVNQQGALQNGLVSVGGNLRYFFESGEKMNEMAQDAGWVWSHRGWIFVNENAKVYHDQFITFGPKIRYYMGSDGTLQQGLVKANGTVYRMQGERGSLLQQASSYTHQGKWYFAAENGEPYRNRIISFGAKRYLMGADGSRQDGTVTVNGVAYRCDVAAGTVEKVHDYDFLWPVAGRTRISSGFGIRWGHMHKGIDIPAPTGTPVRAAHGGSVVAAGYHNSCGNYVQLVGDNGLFTNYFHLSKILATPGQTVQEGEVIGLVGSTGNSTGAHLHFEVRTGGNWGQAHNPLNYSYTY